MNKRQRRKQIDLEIELEGRLLSLRNMVDLALLAVQSNRHNLVPTAIEEAYLKAQTLIELYCVKDK